MPDHPNVDRVRRTYGAFNNQDLDAVAELLADDVVWHVPGRSPIAGDHHGREATLGYLGGLADLTGGSYQAELHIAVGDNEHVITVHHSSATRAGRRYDENEIVVFRFHDHEVVDIWQAPMNPYAHDDFFS
jgi:ketosteroid isomerase-like protein